MECESALPRPRRDHSPDRPRGTAAARRPVVAHVQPDNHEQHTADRLTPPVRLPDLAKLRNDLVSAATDQLEPPIRPSDELVEVDGAVLVVAKIDPLPFDQRPCYVKSRGIATGSFVRTGDGDRWMTQAEIGLAIANRGQPRYDVEPVPEAGLEDLDGAALVRTLARVRETSRSLRDVDDETVLQRIRVLVPHENGKIVPSVAGVLTFGVFPQQFFPQLTISLVVIPGVESHGADAPRFEDNPVS